MPPTPSTSPLPFTRPEERFINRELSWLAFNTRVLEEAENATHPLLERVKFLSISASNLDEFYMVRVAGLFEGAKAGVTEKSQDGLTPKEQLKRIHKKTDALMQAQRQCWKTLKSQLEEQNITFLVPSELKKSEHSWLKDYFMSHIFPALTPIAIDPAHPFPFLPNLSMAVLLSLEKPAYKKDGTEKAKKERLNAIILLPHKLDRFILLPSKNKKKQRIILLEHVIELFEQQLFPGAEVLSSGLIRIIRDSELELAEEAEDLVRQFESAVKRRRKGSVIRLETNGNLSEALQKLIEEEFEVTPRDIVVVDGMLGMEGLSALYDLDRPELKFPPHTIRFPERIGDYDGDCFAAIRAKDIVIHHPYESFDVVVRMLHQAAADPDVIAIKQTLYRTSNDSPIVKALIEAAEAGKSVTVMVELKARFDEEANIRWGRNLERAGAQVIYGVVGLKTHAKVSLVVRKEGDTMRSYVHFGTGNYHPITAKIYTDLSFFTCDPALARDASSLFNYLTGYSPPDHFEKIATAPLHLRETLLRHIDEEIQHAKAGRPAMIWAKMNSLVDASIIDALYAASQAGVSITLIVRGICCLRPGIPGFSDNITVKSIVGRFLEHSRIFCFGNGHELPSANALVYISSADWMPRNFYSRVELMVPITNSTVHEQILGQIITANINDERQSWILQPDGSYTRIPFDAESFSAHDFFMHNPSLSGRGTALHGAKKTNKKNKTA